MPVTSAIASEFSTASWGRKIGVRMTRARRDLFAVIASMPDHFDAEGLCAECHRRAQPVSRATIYRTLPRLCRAGFLRSSEFGDGRHVFSRSASDGVPLAEIYVVDCGRIVEVPAPFLSWYAQTVTAKAGYELIGQRLQTFARCPRQSTPGACENCQAKPPLTPSIPAPHS